MLVGACLAKPPAPDLNDGGPTDDAFTMVDCTGVAFPPLVRVLALPEPNFIGDPTMTANELELYYTVSTTRGVWDLGYARRASKDDPFSAVADAFPFNNDYDEEADPAVTADGLTLVFVRRGSGSPARYGYYTTRSTRGEVWPSPVPIPGLANTPMEQIDISADGLTLYYVTTVSPYSMYSATRAQRDANFSPTPTELTLERSFPSVSSTGLELFFNNSTTSVDYATRSATTEPFGQSAVLFPEVVDPDIIGNDQLLITYSMQQRSIHVYRRTCVSTTM
jgi:hypothetical protein